MIEYGVNFKISKKEVIRINTETKEEGPETIQTEVTKLDPRLQQAFDSMDRNKENDTATKKSLKGMKTYIATTIILLLYFILKVISSP